MFKGYNEETEELVEIKSDVSTGAGVHQGEIVSGLQTTVRQKAFAYPRVRYKDLVLECDLYKAGDEIIVHMYCPKCRHNLQISSKRKAIELDEQGRLSVEPFQCTWEMDDELLGDHRAWGFSLCNLKLAIDKGIAKDA